MYKILIDSSKRYEKEVKLARDGEVIDKRSGDIDINVEIREILEKNKLKIADVDEFYANPGPGSFTGLKIGVTVANILNWVTGKRKISELTYPKYGAKPNIHKTPWLEK